MREEIRKELERIERFVDTYISRVDETKEEIKRLATMNITTAGYLNELRIKVGNLEEYTKQLYACNEKLTTIIYISISNKEVIEKATEIKNKITKHL